MTLKVAIIGRPNVGKSTLFNRLVGRRLAIVHNEPGVTRDRRTAPASLGDLRFDVMDTAGLEEADPSTMEGRMRIQTDMALKECDVALFLIDAREGVSPLDAHFADIMRRIGTPVILLANKCEGRSGAHGLGEAYALGLGEPVPVSAEHGQGLGDLYDALLPFAQKYQQAEEPENEDDQQPAQAVNIDHLDLPEGLDLDDYDFSPDDFDADEQAHDVQQRPLRIAIVGRPNTGKSTLVNTLCGEERMLTGPEAGVTRDAITVDLEYHGRKISIVDTAGMRRKSKVRETVESMSVQNTLHALRMAEVVILLVDSNMILDKQELNIARMVVEEGRAMVIGVNKWDACENRNEAMRILKDKLDLSLSQVKGIPTVNFSALNDRNVDRLIDKCFDVYETWNSRIPTSELNRWIAYMTERHPPPMGTHGKRLRIRYATQAKARPPTFALFVSKPDNLPDSYLRFLENGLREDFGLDGVPIRMVMRKPKNPFVS